MWRRLQREHERQPFSLLLHGGDQLYADEMLLSHPTLADWNEADPDDKPGHAFSPDAEQAATRYLLDAYVDLYSQPEFAFLARRVPSVMIWDDHDIMDGWGSHPTGMLDSPIGRGLFALCRRLFMLFQLGRQPDHWAASGDDQLAPTLTYAVSYPEIAVVVPDLRSERRPDCILAQPGWSALDQALQNAAEARHVC